MKIMIYEDEDRDRDEDEKRTQSAIVIVEKILELPRITLIQYEIKNKIREFRLQKLHFRIQN